MPGAEALAAHLAEGHGSVARAWAITRADGTQLGFTDHDMALSFEGITFEANGGLTAKAISQATGLSIDNTEAMGALTHDAIREEDIAAGRYDGAEVVVWLVNWADVSARRLMFRGHIGEVKRVSGAFHAEIQGLSERLNRPVGRVFQQISPIALGDPAFGFDPGAPSYVHEGVLDSVEDQRVFVVDGLDPFALGWFQRGKLTVLDGDAHGLSVMIKRDRFVNGQRQIETWETLRAHPAVGDRVRLLAGYDGSFDTCRIKFNNAINFQGFPDVPEEDWLTISPGQATRLDGGSRR